MPKKISILGSTGSVGTSTLKVIDAMPERFEVVLLSAHRSKEVLLEQARRFQPHAIAIGQVEDAAWLRERLDGLPTRVVAGARDLVKLVGDLEADLTIAAIVGAAGLEPTMAAIRAGSHIGLANKESMVVAGPFMKQAAGEADVDILPIDSEHNALHQCLRGERHAEVKRLILTASGGPFRTYAGNFEEITPEQALRHPTWEMGPKITIDCATLMNKGLEVIEAHHLFHFPASQIDIVIHPQSLVHSMIETVDGSYKCQLGRTDMCDPILYALTYPERWPNPFGGLDITSGLDLTFHPVDKEKFPCIQLAYDALAMLADDTGINAQCAAPAVLNAANEISVAAFLEGRINFTDIPRINSRCLERMGESPASDLDAVMELDRQTRTLAHELTGRTKSAARSHL